MPIIDTCHPCSLSKVQVLSTVNVLAEGIEVVLDDVGIEADDWWLDLGVEVQSR